MVLHRWPGAKAARLTCDVKCKINGLSPTVREVRDIISPDFFPIPFFALYNITLGWRARIIIKKEGTKNLQIVRFCTTLTIICRIMMSQSVQQLAQT